MHTGSKKCRKKHRLTLQTGNRLKKQVENTLVSPVELHRVLSLFIHLRLCHYSLMKAAGGCQNV